MTDEERGWIRQLNASDAVVINKSDLQQKITEKAVRALNPGVRCLTVSAVENNGIRPIRDYLQERAEIGDQLAITQPRHLEAVRRAVGHLEDALRTLEQWTPDLAATDLQAAQNALSEVTGDQADEKLLDKVFSEFCVGK